MKGGDGSDGREVFFCTHSLGLLVLFLSIHCTTVFCGLLEACYGDNFHWPRCDNTR